MKLISLNTVTLALVLLGVSGMIVPTGAAPGGGADQAWAEPAITLEPADGPNGQYASIGRDGNLSVDISNVNADAETVVRDVFTITNNEDVKYRVWVSHDASNAVKVVVDGSRSLQDAGNPVVLAAGAEKSVSLVIDSRGRSANEVLMSSLTLHAERVSSKTATPTPTTTETPVEATEPSPTPTETASVNATPTASPPPTPTETQTPEPDEVEAIQVSVDVETADTTGESSSPTTPTDSGVTVREMNESELNENELAEPRAQINRSDGPTAGGAQQTDQTSGTARTTSITKVGQPVDLSGSRSTVGQVTGVDDQRRVAKLVDVQVPEEQRKTSGTITVTVARSKFGETDPKNATIGHRTEDGWELLDTRVVSSTERTVTLQARTTGFSPFAVFVDPQVSYRWTLPDGSVVKGREVRPAFDEPGIYNVSLTVFDALGRSDSTRHQVIVNDRPTVSIEVLGNATGDGPTTLRANVTDELGNHTITWTFADGSTTTGATVTREFAEGETVRVTVEDEYGAQGRTAATVRQSTGADGQPAIGVVQFNLGLQSRLAIVGLVVVLLIMGLRWLAARRYAVA